MKLASIQRFCVLVTVLVLLGCSTNKTGSNFNLARVNPFHWIKPDSETKPYPQKPSSFASPTDPSGRSSGAIADSSKGGTLPATASAQAYPGTQAGYQSVDSPTYPSTASVRSGTPYSPMPQSYPAPTATSSSDGYSANPVTATSWQSTPAGVATASDQRNFSQPAYSSTTSLPENTSNSGYSRIPDNTSYPSTTSPPPSAGSGGSYRFSAVTPQSQMQSSVAQDTAGSGNTDWAKLVGERYAQLYQKGNNTPPATDAIGNTGYSPGDTGYVPGRLENPPGNVDYQPGQTGYNPPGVPPYVMPYGSNSQPTNTSVGTWPATNSAGEYRPGSTKTYIPRTGNQPSGNAIPTTETNQSTTGGLSSFPTAGSLSTQSSNLSQTSSSVNEPFRM